MYSITGKVSFSWYPVLAVKVNSGISDANHVMLLPIEIKSLATSVDAAYICIPSWRDFANVYCTVRTAGFDKRYELVVFFFK